MIPAGAHERLTAHVKAMLAASSIPAIARDDVAEELLGHLVERCRSLIEKGVEPDAAADRAIAEFGAAPRIGRDLTRAYRGRLWASTIGPLLPERTRTGRPLAISLFAIQSFALSALYVGAGGWALANHSPLHALLLGIGAALAGGALLLVGFGLLQGQPWALVLATLGSVVLLIDGAVQFTRSTVSLSALLAGASLFAYLVGTERVHGWLSPARPPSSSVLVGVALALPLLAPLVPMIPDPTQATPADLHLHVDVDCDATVEVWADQSKVTEPGIRITVDARWSRTSLLPGGVADARPVDTLAVWLPDEWSLVDDRLFDLTTGEHVPGAGGSGPGVPLEAGDWTWSAGIPHTELREGRTIRFEVTLADAWIGPRTLPLPREPIIARYWHAGAFTVERSAGCSR